MELKGRLKLIASMVPLCNTMCDIGTDHAYVPIFLVKNKICNKAIASDLRKGPVLRAEDNIRDFGMENYIESRLGNGLEDISKEEAQTVVIAGMGGVLIEEILSRDIEKAKNAVSLILQPMYAIEVVRKWLYENGFSIYDEGLVQEGNKIYNVIAACWAGKVEKPDPIYYYIGSKLVEKKAPLVVKYINSKIRQTEKIIRGMKKSENAHIELKHNIWLRDGLEKLLEEI